MSGSASGRPAREPQDAPFSIDRMRGSLARFALGKVASGLIGIAWLLMLVRLLDVTSYGGYVVLLALLEIVLLVSNAGVYPFAQRYITEARLPNYVGLLPRLVWRSLGYRLATLTLCAAGMMLCAPVCAAWLGQPLLAQALPIYAFIILFEGGARYLELVFESMLEQGRAQACAIVRNGARVTAVLAIWGALDDPFTLQRVVTVETVTSAIGLTLAAGMMRGTLACIAAGARVSEQGARQFGLQRFLPFAVPLYAAQCLTQLYSPDALKLVVSRLLGVAEAAAFGFAHALSFVLQRYLPANLLIGLVRPMLVARRAHDAGADAQLVQVGNLVLKVNHFLLLPLATLFAVAGREFAALASGGKYADAGPLLCMLTLLLIPAGTHVVLSMLATALEDRRAVLVGTLVSVPGVFVGIALAPHWGSHAMALGLWSSELLWCGFTLWLLRRRGFVFAIDLGAWLRLVAAAGVAAIAAAGVLWVWPIGGAQRLALATLVVAPVYLGACAALRPWSTLDTEMLSRLLPLSWQRQGSAIG